MSAASRSPADQSVTINAGHMTHTQVGDGNVMNVTSSQVLADLAHKIETSPDVSQEKKGAWIATLRDIASSRVAVAAVTAGVGAAVTGCHKQRLVFRYGGDILVGMQPHAAALTVRVVAALLVCLAVTACGSNASRGGQSNEAGAGGEGGGTMGLVGTCALRAEVSGGTTIHFTGQNDAACATILRTDTGLDGIFTGTDAKGSLELIVDDVAEGETGADYPTRIVVTSTARAIWQGSTCITTIGEHRLVATEMSEIGEIRRYQVRGEGTCAEPLEPVAAGAEPVMIGPFAFHAQFSWRD
jgi:hypothetical protein